MNNVCIAVRSACLMAGVLLALAACGRGDSVAVSVQPATSPTLDAYPAPEGNILVLPVIPPTPTDGSFNENGEPRPTFTAADLTQIALKEANYKAERDMRATAEARPTLTPNTTPFLTYTPEPYPTPMIGLYSFDECGHEQVTESGATFRVYNCWFIEDHGMEIGVGAGGYDSSRDPATSTWRSGLIIVTNPIGNPNDLTIEPVYWTPENKGTVEMTAANGMVLTVAADDGTLFTFDVATRTWGPPPTPTPVVQPEAQPTSTVEAQPEAQATPTSPVTIFVPWAQ